MRSSHSQYGGSGGQEINLTPSTARSAGVVSHRPAVADKSSGSLNRADEGEERACSEPVGTKLPLSSIWAVVCSHSHTQLCTTHSEYILLLCVLLQGVVQ